MEPRIIIDEKKLSAILASLSKICKGKLRFLEDGSQYYINSDRRNLPFCRILSRSQAATPCAPAVTRQPTPGAGKAAPFTATSAMPAWWR